MTDPFDSEPVPPKDAPPERSLATSNGQASHRDGLPPTSVVRWQKRLRDLSRHLRARLKSAVPGRETQEKLSSRFLLAVSPFLPMVIASGAAIAVLAIAYTSLVRPSGELRSPLSCRGKLNGRWQAAWGSVTFAERKNSPEVKGNYTLQNLDRGSVKGELVGTLHENVLEFTWKESAERGTRQQQGRGVLIFGNNCQEFYGSTGIDNTDTGHGLWRGSPIRLVPLRK